MSRTRYFTFVMVIIAGFVVVQNRIGQIQLPMKADLDDRIARINEVAQSQMAVATIMLGAIFLLSVACHLSNRRSTGL